MVRILVLLLGALSQRRLSRYEAAVAGAAAGGWAGNPGPHRPADTAFRLHEPADPATQVLPPVPAPPPSPSQPPSAGPRRRRRIPRSVKWGVFLVLVGLLFRRVIAAVVVTALSATLHLFGLNVHLPHIRFGWPWQAAPAITSTNIDVGPWVLQKIEGISKPALGTETFNFVFTHKVSKNVGPWPCWYSSTFYAVGHASATVNLNPGPSWWTGAAGHYLLRVVSRPVTGRPGAVSITMVLPPPQLPQNVHDVTIDNTLSKPLSTDHSWTYPGLGCGALIKPQFSPSVVYASAQQEAFYRVSHLPSVTQPLIRTAESQAALIIRNNFIQPTVNALGYTLDRFTLRWAAGS